MTKLEFTKLLKRYIKHNTSGNISAFLETGIRSGFAPANLDKECRDAIRDPNVSLKDKEQLLHFLIYLEALWDVVGAGSIKPESDQLRASEKYAPLQL